MTSPDAIPDGLYHYTDSAGLHGIINQNVLWATHAAYLNDSQEFRYGMQLILDELNQMHDPQPPLPPSLPEADPERRAVLIGVLPFLIAQALQMLLQQRTEFLRQNAGPYVTCLSAARDQLSQWRGYGAGGYAVRFDPQALQQSLAQYKPQFEPPTEDIIGVPVLERRLVRMEYEPSDQIPYIREQISQFIQRFVAALADEQLDPQQIGERVLTLLKSELTPYLSTALDLATRLKHPGFEEEKEYRIVTFSPPEFFTPNAIGLIPRVNVAFDPRCIKEVLVGPGPHMETRESSLRAFFQVHRDKYPEAVVCRSETPFTGK